jgi:hypothetical protein
MLPADPGTKSKPSKKPAQSRQQAAVAGLEGRFRLKQGIQYDYHQVSSLKWETGKLEAKLLELERSVG